MSRLTDKDWDKFERDINEAKWSTQKVVLEMPRWMAVIMCVVLVISLILNLIVSVGNWALYPRLELLERCLAINRETSK